MKNNVSTLLKSSRKERGWSVKEVSEKLKEHGVSAAEKTIYGWESGKRQPDADTFMVLCEIYGVQTLPDMTKSPDPEGPRDEKETLFMSLFDQLTDEHKRFLIAVMQVLLEQGL